MKPCIRAAIAVCALLIALTVPAGAHSRHHGHHHSYTDGQPHAWCGWYMRRLLGVQDRTFNLARAWAQWGRPAGGPIIGAVVVWRHHVGRIVGPCEGLWCMVHSGNDGHAVRTRLRSVAHAIAFRVPG